MKTIKKTIYPNGTVQYYQNDKLHREDGPAIEFEDGSVQWYKNNLLHREDGPAVIKYDYTGKIAFIEYYLDDINYTKEEWMLKLRKNKLKKFQKSLRSIPIHTDPRIDPTTDPDR